MNMDRKQYKKYVAAHAPKTPLLKNCLRAFLVGGRICCLGELIIQTLCRLFSLPREDAGTITSVLLIFFAVLLTAIGIFDKIARFAGAGTLVPITGFANSVASPAIDSRAEGLVPGIGTKIFTVCGPVLLYGTLSGVVYGIIYWIWFTWIR